jgi:pimeloyl-ACP methyl ester carboxylesterase
VQYHTTQVDGLKIFYHEAGPKNAPKVVLLHGFPSSSHMFRELIPQLSDKYHVVAPDYPGYGYSDAPSTDKFECTFELAPFDQNLLIPLDLSRLRQIVIKLVSRLLTEGLWGCRFESIPQGSREYSA